MKLRREVDRQTFREVTKEMDTALDQLDREHKRLASEAAMRELPAEIATVIAAAVAHAS
jgi:hypothetical protein